MRGQGHDRARTTGRLAMGLALCVVLAACAVVLARGGTGFSRLSDAGISTLAFAALDWAGDRAWEFTHAVGTWARQGYADHPALMLGLASGAALPLIAVAKGVSRGLSRRRAARAEAGSCPGGDQLALRRRRPWIEPQDGAGARHYLGELTTIGSGEDCDLLTHGANRAETYAVVEAAGDGEFLLLDMSGGMRTALRVNGRAVARGILEDGDRIEIGASRFVFHQPPPTTLYLRPAQASASEAHTTGPPAAAADAGTLAPTGRQSPGTAAMKGA